MEFRQSYIRESNERLESLREDIDRLSDRYQTSESSARSELSDSLQTLRDKEQQVRAHIEEMMNSTEESWEQLKEGFETVYRELEIALENAVSRIDDRHP